MVLVVLAGVVGIAVAQIRRARLAATLVAVMLVFLGGTVIWPFQVHPLRVLHPFMYRSYERTLPESFTPQGWGVDSPSLTPPSEHASTWHAIFFDSGALGWHLVYVGGLIVLGVWIATRLADQSDRSTPTRWLALVGRPLLLVGGVAQIVTAGTNG